MTTRLICFWVGLVLAAAGCGGEPRKAGELCEEGDECPAGLDCEYTICPDRSKLRFCTKKCEKSLECTEFSQPYCEYLGGFTLNCIELGNNPCTSPP